MKSFKAFCIGTIATIGLATGASAQTFSPPGNHTLSNVGTITVSKGITLSCGLTGGGNVTGGAAKVTSLSLTGGLCGLVSFSAFPYALTSTSTSTVTINNVQVVGITGNCAGNLTGAFNQTTGRITFSGATLPSSPPGGAPCVITGVVATTPPVSFTIP